jgi:Dihydroorotate dehydrogenase
MFKLLRDQSSGRKNTRRFYHARYAGSNAGGGGMYNKTMNYALLRPLLFALDAETAHAWTLSALDALAATGCEALVRGAPALCPRRIMGIEFPNPVGLAAGLDKNGDHIDALAALGFGFLEIGTVTPRAQAGNPKPRLFRLPAAHAVINRMGFNNAGVAHLIERVRHARYRGVLGINIGKNFDTPLARAADDYLTCLRQVYPLASYVTVNISSPMNWRRCSRPSSRSSNGWPTSTASMYRWRSRLHPISMLHRFASLPGC